MKARKIDLTDYHPGEADEKGDLRPYLVRKSLVTILLSPMQQHDAMSLLAHGKLADKIEEFVGDHILLDSSDYTLLKSALLRIKGLGANDRELARRVVEAEEVEMAEAKKE
jgi:hypothetical protein